MRSSIRPFDIIEFARKKEVQRSGQKVMTPEEAQMWFGHAWDTHVPVPPAIKSRLPETDFLRAMPIGASKFYPVTSDQAASYCKSASRPNRKYVRRARTEDGVHGMRIWRVA